MPSLSGKARWDGDVLVLSPKANARVSRRYLSPSSANAYRSCPARFAVERLIPRPKDPFGAAEIGTAAHAVLEELMTRDPSRRTKEEARAIATAHLPAAAERVSAVVEVFSRLHSLGPSRCTADAARKLAREVPLSYMDGKDLVDRVDMVLDQLDGRPIRRGLISQLASSAPGAREVILPAPEDMARWVDEIEGKVQGLWDIEDPSKADVWYRELRVEQDIAGVPVLGYIDRVDRGANGIPIPIDYKTGKPYKGDKHGHQLRVYSLAVAHLTHVMPHRALVYYTAHGKREEVNVSQQAISTTVEMLRQTWAEVKSSQEAAAWVARPSHLCGWCPLALVCPAAKAAGKAVARSEIAKTGPELGIGGAAHVAAPAPSRDVMADKGGPMDMRFGPEAKAWEQEVNGQLNPNSYAATAVFGTVEMAVEVLEAAGERLTPQKVDSLALTFAKILSDAHYMLGSRFSWQDGLNTRLRGALHSALGRNPVPIGRGEAEWEAWYQAVLRRTVSIARASLRLWGADLGTERPWAPLIEAASSVAA